MRILFMGSPAEVIHPLRMLMERSQTGEHDLIGVVSQPARPFGRKQIMTDPPVASFAKSAGLLVWQPEKASDPNFLESIRHLQPDLIITAAYGQILSDAFLAIPRRATINIHPSMLPKYRGATPVPAALLDGCHETGISILFTVKALDAGALIVQEKYSIEPHETAEALTDRLFRASSRLLEQAIHLLEDPNFQGTPQDPDQVSFCKKIQKHDGALNWQKPAARLHHEFRAYFPWPGSFTHLNGIRIVVEECNPSGDHSGYPLVPGAFRLDREFKALRVGTVEGDLLITKLKPAGSKSLDALSFWNGAKIQDIGLFT